MANVFSIRLMQSLVFKGAFGNIRDEDRLIGFFDGLIIESVVERLEFSAILTKFYLLGLVSFSLI